MTKKIEPMIIPVAPVHGEHSRVKTFSCDSMRDLPRFEQSQKALNEQLRDLYHVANRLGLYDAADYLEKFK